MAMTSFTMVDLDGGWVGVYDGAREVIRLRPPGGDGLAGIKKLSVRDVLTLERQILRVLERQKHGAN